MSHGCGEILGRCIVFARFARCELLIGPRIFLDANEMMRISAEKVPPLNRQNEAPDS